MKRKSWLVAMVIVAAVFPIGCGDDDCPNCPPEDRKSRTYIDASSYIKSQYFDLTRRDSILSLADLQPGDSVTYLELYLIAEDAPDGGIDVVALVDPFDSTRYSHETIRGKARKIDPVWDGDFRVQRQMAYVLLDSPLKQGSNLGAYIEYRRRIHGSADTIITVGQLPGTGDDNLVLKLIHRNNLVPNSVTRDYMWRNVYDIGRVTDLDDLVVRVHLKSGPPWQMDIEKDTDSQDGVPFISILQLDEDNDGQLDVYNVNILDPYQGHLRFPDREPFISPLLAVRDSIVYFPPLLWPSETRGSYYIVVERTSANSTY